MTQSDIINNNFSKAFECIKCSNAYDTGAVLSEEKLFKQISERRHSTFDKSKFTIVGSPTITDDGVASGFSGSDYITLPISLSEANSWQIILKNNSLYSNGYLLGGNILNTIAYIKGAFYISSNGTSWDVASNVGTLTDIPANSLIQLEFTGSKYISKYSTDNGLNWNITGELNSNVKITDKLDTLYVGVIVGGEPANCSIDLKQFSITVDGKEVFSGNKTGIDVINDIEIPYTLSKTGSKIVDVAYRDRVIDLYEQEGQAGYYTIDEDNKNFTLPMGEIYGMIGGSSSTGGSGLELCDIGMALYIDETKGLRRYLNGQIVDRNANTEAFFTRLQEITTLHPSLLCTEEEWQTSKTMSAFGQVGKFVFNYSGDEIISVRIPRVVNVQGLFDLQNLGMTVDESLPNIKGTIGDNLSWVTPSALGAFVASRGANQNAAGTTSTAFARYSFNASRSSSTYQDNAPVQQEAIQYPYFIQIATGSETENNIINEIELNNPYSLFDSKYSDHELNNLSWLKSEGQWNSGTVYVDAYNELLAEYNNAESVEETEGTVTFKRTPKGYKIALANQENAIDTKYSTDGIAWYYILDTANEKFKLPRTKFGFEGLRTSVGDDIKAGLPNITGTFKSTYTIAQDNGIDTTGAFQSPYSTSTGYYGGSNADPNWGYGFKFDASRSNSIYGNNTTVQPPATQMYLYFYVGETVQNANLIDAGRIGEQLATKTDMLQASGAGMPSGKYINLTLGASGTAYTAPANGWFSCNCQCIQDNPSGNMYFALHNHSNETGDMRWFTNTTNLEYKGMIPCKKGDYIAIGYNAKRVFVDTWERGLRFYYAEGEI